MLRQAKPGRGGRKPQGVEQSETSCCDPSGASLEPARIGHPPGPSVAWCGGDPGCELDHRQGSAKRRQRSAARWRLSRRRRLIVQRTVGNSPGRTHPREVADRSRHTSGGADDAGIGSRDHPNATTGDCGIGERGATDAAVDAGAPHRPDVNRRGVPAHAQGRRSGSGRRHGRGVRAEAAREPERPAQAVQERSLSRAAGQTRAHSQGWGEEHNPAHRHSHPATAPPATHEHFRACAPRFGNVGTSGSIAARMPSGWVGRRSIVCLNAIPSRPCGLCTASMPRNEGLGRGAGCPNRARPDLWEPRVSNHPRSPGPFSVLYRPFLRDCSNWSTKGCL